MQPHLILIVTFVAVTVGGSAAYIMRRDSISRRRIEAGQCVRCGAHSPEFVDMTDEDVDPAVPLLMCPGCVARTRWHHLIVFWAFAAMFALVVAIIGAEFTGDLRRGAYYSLGNYWWISAILVLPLWRLLRLLRRRLNSGGRLLDHDETAQSRPASV